MREPTADRARPTAMTSRAPTRLVLALVVAALGLAPALLLAGPAYACSCVPMPLADQVAAADVLVVGAVDSMESRDRTKEVTIAVDQVVRGDVGTGTLRIRTADSGAACGLDFLEVGERYAFFAARSTVAGAGDVEPPAAGLCGGTTSLRPGLVEKLEAAAAEAPPVGTAGTAGESPPTATPDDAPEGPEPGRAEPSPLLIGLVVAGTALVGAGVVAWWRRRT